MSELLFLHSGSLNKIQDVLSVQKSKMKTRPFIYIQMVLSVMKTEVLLLLFILNESREILYWKYLNLKSLKAKHWEERRRNLKIKKKIKTSKQGLKHIETYIVNLRLKSSQKLLHKTGKKLVGIGTIHINIWYFLGYIFHISC